ncbi:MAG: hypothetical protein AB1564_09480 [Chloroflexota bacterium]
MMETAAWIDQSLRRLDLAGSRGAAAANYLRRHRVGLGFHDQPTAARWTIFGGIQLHPRYALAPPDDPYALSLIVHETRHLQQGFFTALSVMGELEAWQEQFEFYQSLTGRYAPAAALEPIIAELMTLSMTDRAHLRRARELMRDYAGPKYRIYWLPLYPLGKEIAHWLNW